MATKKAPTKTNEKAQTPSIEGTEAGNSLTVEDTTETLSPPTQLKKFARKEAVTVPTRSIDDNETIWVTIKNPFDVREKIDPKTGEVELEKDGKTAKTITVATVVDLQRDDEIETPMSLVVGSVLESNLERKYPEQGYVGMSFEITKRPVDGKRYKAYEVFSLEV